VPTPITEADATRLRDDTAELQKAYQIAFSGEAGQIVLADLARFCRANEPCWSPDQRFHALLEGRREGWLRIQSQCDLTVEELMQRRLGDTAIVVRLEGDEDNNG